MLPANKSRIMHFLPRFEPWNPFCVFQDLKAFTTHVTPYKVTTVHQAYNATHPLIHYLHVHAGVDGEDSRASGLHPVQRMAIAMAEALAAGQASEGTGHDQHDQVTHSSDSTATMSSLTLMVHETQLQLQTSMAGITRALSRMDARMTRAETSLMEMEQRFTKKLDTIQESLSPHE